MASVLKCLVLGCSLWSINMPLVTASDEDAGVLDSITENMYGKQCLESDQCLGPHLNCSRNSSICVCADRYRPAPDHSESGAPVCRPTKAGLLGHRCRTIADCNWNIEHVVCHQNRCQCDDSTSGFSNGNQCYTGTKSWTVISHIAGALCLILVVAFLVILVYRYITRSRLTRSVHWLHRRGSHVSLRWSVRSRVGSLRRRSLRRSLRRTPCNTVANPTQHAADLPAEAAGIDNGGMIIEPSDGRNSPYSQRQPNPAVAPYRNSEPYGGPPRPPTHNDEPYSGLSRPHNDELYSGSSRPTIHNNEPYSGSSRPPIHNNEPYNGPSRPPIHSNEPYSGPSRPERSTHSDEPCSGPFRYPTHGSTAHSASRPHGSDGMQVTRGYHRDSTIS